MKNDGKSGCYTVTPARLVCPAGAIHATAPRGVDTLVSLPATIATAKKQGEELCRLARRYGQHNQWPALAQLVADYPYISTVPDIRHALVRLAKAGRLRAAPGRPRGAFRLSPLTVWGMVKTLCESGEASSNEQAFHGLSRTLGYVSSDRVKQLYYQAITEPRFHAVLYASGQTIDVDAVPPSAVKLPPGGRVSYHGADEQGHAMSVRFDEVAAK